MKLKGAIHVWKANPLVLNDLHFRRLFAKEVQEAQESLLGSDQEDGINIKIVAPWKVRSYADNDDTVTNFL
ncbi:hypothetical protein RUM44_004221 [Polyplax serrata]|uniref:Uncharacterized protein n=1 Tax=Polyplax serrata TaxID=468196 RepID=A0ABR1B282_POLSC